MLVAVPLALALKQLIPGIDMRLESFPSPTPLILFHLCLQPPSVATRALEPFRNEVELGARGGTSEAEAAYDGVALQTAALGVYVGTASATCSTAEDFGYVHTMQCVQAGKDRRNLIG